MRSVSATTRAAISNKRLNGGVVRLSTRPIWRGTRGFTAASLAAIGRLREAREIVLQMQTASPGRRLREVLDDLAYQDPERRQRYGEHLAAAGYPE